MKTEIHNKNLLNFINNIIDDPLTEKLIEKSHLTKIQTETLLIHYLTNLYSDGKPSFDLKGKLRSIIDYKKIKFSNQEKVGVSRGAFRRVLSQAAKNITKSIYTLILLGYLGLLESPSIQPFFELSSLVKEYYNVVKESRLESQELYEQKLKILFSQIESLIEKYTEVLLIKK